MNTIVKTIPGGFRQTNIYDRKRQRKTVSSANFFCGLQLALFSKSFWSVTILVSAIFVSMLSVVYVQAENRISFSQLSSLEKQRDNLHLEWGQLLLEESTWSTQTRIENVAKADLNMVIPKQKNITILS